MSFPSKEYYLSETTEGLILKLEPRHRELQQKKNLGVLDQQGTHRAITREETGAGERVQNTKPRTQA